MTPPTPGAGGSRRHARECALQVLYALDLGAGDAVDQALAYYWKALAGDEGAGPVDAAVVEFAERLVRGTMAEREAIDGIVQSASKNWRLERMARVDRNLLRLASYELKHEVDVPARVVINEAIELAKRFGTAESPAFVNGLLDRICQDLGRGAS
jgi:N utilization substance protein B